MNRQAFAGLAGIAASAAVLGRAAAAQPGGAHGALATRVAKRFSDVPGKKALLIDVAAPTGRWRVSSNPGSALFCGSAFKTYVLATYLREVEAGRLSLSEQLRVDDGVRSIGGGVFDHLTGTTSARVVLEAMISHSDNTATDIAMKRVGPAKVRAFIREIGLRHTRIPDSTRRFFSYIAGYPAGADMGWKGIQSMMRGREPYRHRPAINDRETMVGSPEDFVSYYSRALRGDFFQKPETLKTFKSILWQANAVFVVVPDATPAYMKGGSIDFDDFYCLSVAGQMIAGQTPVTFALTLNWTKSEATLEANTQRFAAVALDILTSIKKASVA